MKKVREFYKKLPSRCYLDVYVDGKLYQGRKDILKQFFEYYVKNVETQVASNENIKVWLEK